MDLELESFKTGIDLRAYAAAQGYELDRKNSCRGSAVMRHPAGDKIIIKLDSDNHYVFFSIHRNVSGSIIDFAQMLQNLSLGSVRKELRPWLSRPPARLPDFPALPKTAKDRMRVETAYARMQEATNGHPYLEQHRAIPVAVLGLDRFAGRVRIDDRGNAVFPHFDEQGLSGYEIKNRGFTGFARGGEKGLWMSHTRNDDNRLVLCESALDALSYAVLFPDSRARYASIGGKPNPHQPELIRTAIRQMPHGAEIVAAMDNDADGAVLAGVVRHAVELSGRLDLKFILHEPIGFKDWNDQLRAKPHPLLPYRPQAPSVV